MKNIALYFGSFNPIHNTHLYIADYISKLDYINEVQLVISPQNPFKNDLADYDDRCNMCELATLDYNNITVNTIESTLPTPSYTINALNALSFEKPNNKYYMIMGLDIWLEIDKWKNYKEICELYPFIVLPREFDNDSNKTYFNLKKTELLNNGIIINKETKLLNTIKISSLSSTKIRNDVRNSENISIFVTEIVDKYILKHKLYK